MCGVAISFTTQPAQRVASPHYHSTPITAQPLHRVATPITAQPLYLVATPITTQPLDRVATPMTAQPPQRMAWQVPLPLNHPRV